MPDRPSSPNSWITCPPTSSKSVSSAIAEMRTTEASPAATSNRGYIDFERLHAFTLELAFFVAHTKENVLLQRRHSHPVDKSTGVRSDQTVVLAAAGSSAAYPDALRRVSCFDAVTGKRLVFLTNNFTLPAPTIAQFTSSVGKSSFSLSGSSNICASSRSTAPARTPSKPKSKSPTASMSWSPSFANA